MEKQGGLERKVPLSPEDNNKDLIDRLNKQRDALWSEYNQLEKEIRDRETKDNRLHQSSQADSEAIVEMMRFNNENPEFFVEAKNMEDIHFNVTLDIFELKSESKQEEESLLELYGILEAAKRRGHTAPIPRIEECIQKQEEASREKFRIKDDMAEEEKWYMLKRLRSEKEYLDKFFREHINYAGIVETLADQKERDRKASSLLIKSQLAYIRANLLEFSEDYFKVKPNPDIVELMDFVKKRICLRLVELADNANNLYLDELEAAKALATKKEVYELMPKIQEFLDLKAKGLSKDPTN